MGALLQVFLRPICGPLASLPTRRASLASSQLLGCSTDPASGASGAAALPPASPCSLSMAHTGSSRLLSSILTRCTRSHTSPSSVISPSQSAATNELLPGGGAGRQGPESWRSRNTSFDLGPGAREAAAAAAADARDGR